jgi:predicted NAD/FAD-binding protein
MLPPRSLRHVHSLVRSPRMLRHVLSLQRFVKEKYAVSRGRDWSRTLREHLRQNGYPSSFGPDLIYPLLSACWGAPLAAIEQFPAYSLLKGMPGRDTGTYEIGGGMAEYMRVFGQQLDRVEVRLSTGIRRIGHDGSFHIEDERGEVRRFDQVVVATASRDAIALLSDLSPAEPLVAVLRRFRHFETEIVIHGDPSFMPPHRADWGIINLFNDGDHAWMTDWSGWRQGLPVFRTWMPPHREAPASPYHRRLYHHLIMTPENLELQRRIAGLQGRAGIWLVGMYAVDVDNHESALLSAIPPALALASESPILRRFLGEVRNQDTHDLSILPAALD